MNWISAVVVVIVLASPRAAVAHEGALRGWGAYRFGMTIEQALAVPGTKISSKEPFCPRKLRLRAGCPTVEFWHLRATSRASIGGSDFDVELAFNGGEQLFQVALSHRAAGTIGDCERHFERALVDLERRHGPLSVGDPPILFTPEVKPTHSNVQLGSSRYAHWSWDVSMMEFAYTGAMVRGNAWSAQRVIRDRRVEVRATHELHYRLSEQDAFELDTERRLGDCRINVVLERDTMANRARSKAK